MRKLFCLFLVYVCCFSLLSLVTINVNASQLAGVLTGNGDLSEWDNDDYTRVATDNGVNSQVLTNAYKESTYDITDHSSSNYGVIDEVYVKGEFGDSGDALKFKLSVRIDGTSYYSGEITHAATGTVGSIYGYEWTQNPDTSSDWTWEDVDDLQIGVAAYYTGGPAYAYCDYIEVYVNYTEAVFINCYNETDGSAISGYDVFFTNPSGTVTYEATGCTNQHPVNISDVPTGDNVLLQVSADNYRTRIYYLDIDSIDSEVIINTYLPPTNTSNAYYINVVGPQGEYGQDPPIEDAKVTIKKYINDTVEYENVSVLYTDANGRADVYLVPDTIYFAEITKSGYDTELVTFQPREIVFADDLVFTFRLIPTGANILPGYDHFWDDITFTGSMELNTGVNWTGNITISYSDSNLSTTNTQLKLMEMDGETLTFIGWFNTTGSNSWSHTFTGINSTRVHVGILWFNNTANYEVSSPVSITILNGEIYNSNVVKFNMQDRFENLFGPLPFDVIGIIGAAFGIVFLVSFGPYNTGLGIMMCGISMGIVHAIGIMWCNAGLTESSILLVPVIIVIAGVYMFTKDPQGHL